MELLFEFRRSPVDIAHESVRKDCGDFVKSSFSVLEPKNGHPVISIAAINTESAIFVASVVNVGESVVDV